MLMYTSKPMGYDFRQTKTFLIIAVILSNKQV